MFRRHRLLARPGWLVQQPLISLTNTTPSAPSTVASQHSIDGAATPPRLRRGIILRYNASTKNAKDGGSHEQQNRRRVRRGYQPSGTFRSADCPPWDGKLRRQNPDVEGDRDGMGLVQSPLFPDVRCQGRERQRYTLGCRDPESDDHEPARLDPNLIQGWRGRDADPAGRQDRRTHRARQNR